MRYVRLGFAPAWWKQIRKAARDCDQTPEEFLLGVIAASYPPAMRVNKRLPESALLDGTRALCESLERVKGEILRSLEGLRPRGTSDYRLKRQLEKTRVGDSLRAAMTRSGLTQTEAAKGLGVAAAAVSQVVTGKKPLPRSWVPVLNEMMGDDWMND